MTIAAVASLETLLNLEAVDKLDPQQRTSPAEPGAARPGDRERDRRADRRTPDHVGDRPQFREHQRRGEDETRRGRPRRPAAGQRRAPAGVAEPDPAVLPGGDPAGHGGQAGQPGAGEADVERGAVPVHPLRGDGGGHRPDRPADRHPDRAGGERRLHSPQQHAPPDPPFRGEAPGRRRGAHRAGQPGELPESRPPCPRCSTRFPAAGTSCSTPQNTDYIDPDVLDLIRDFKEQTGPARGVEVSLVGFRSKYQLDGPDPVRGLLDPRPAELHSPRSRCCKS